VINFPTNLHKIQTILPQLISHTRWL
jgi:hypothetical protein